MTKDEVVKYLIKPICTSTVENEEYRKQLEAYTTAIESLKTGGVVLDAWQAENYLKKLTDGMTKDEAIEMLKHCGAENHCIDYKHRNCGGCNQRKAQDMAIKALKTEAIPINWILDYKDKYTVITSEECDPVKAEVIVDMLAEWAEEKKNDN